MGHYCIDEGGVDLRSLRLLEERRKKRRIKNGREKELLRLEREEDHWSKRKRNTGYIPLKAPIQRGWRREFHLSDETARSKYACFFAEILAVINTVQYSHDRHFTRKKRKAGRKIRVPTQQFLQEIRWWNWAKAKLSDQQRQLFSEVTRVNKRGGHSRCYVFNEPWRFILRVRPNMLTHTKMLDTEAEQRGQEIHNRITRNFLRPAIGKARSKSIYGHYGKHSDRNPPLRKTLLQHLDELKEESIH